MILARRSAASLSRAHMLDLEVEGLGCRSNSSPAGGFASALMGTHPRRKDVCQHTDSTTRGWFDFDTMSAIGGKVARVLFYRDGMSQWREGSPRFLTSSGPPR
jgi:hypothetical protein